MDKKDTRKLLRIYIKPETESDVLEWCENQQNVSISIKTLIRMAISVKGTRDILTLPFGVNALTEPTKEEVTVKKTESVSEEPERPAPVKEQGSLNDIRNAYYSGSDDMDMFDTL